MSSCVAPTAWRTKRTILIYPGGYTGQRPKRSSWHNKEKGGLSPPPPPNPKCYSVFLVLSLYDSTLEVSSFVAPTAWRTKTTILIYPGGWVEQRPKRSSWHNKEKEVLSPPPFNPATFIMTSLEALLKHTLHQ